MGRKQVVFIMTDTQRHDMLGCYGNPDMKTPHLDRLAAEGVRFDRAYTCQPVCGPVALAIDVLSACVCGTPRKLKLFSRSSKPS